MLRTRHPATAADLFQARKDTLTEKGIIQTATRSDHSSDGMGG